MIDINVLVDVLQRRKPFFMSAAKLCDRVSSGGLEGFVSAHAVTTIFYVMRKCADAESAEKALDWLLATFEIAEVGKSVLQRARGLAFSDFEDAVIAVAAEAAKCDYVLTRNIADFAASPVPAISPSEFLSLSR